MAEFVGNAGGLMEEFGEPGLRWVLWGSPAEIAREGKSRPEVTEGTSGSGVTAERCGLCMECSWQGGAGGAHGGAWGASKARELRRWQRKSWPCCECSGEPEECQGVMGLAKRAWGCSARRERQGLQARSWGATPRGMHGEMTMVHGVVAQGVTGHWVNGGGQSRPWEGRVLRWCATVRGQQRARAELRVVAVGVGE